jgi:hypothetical protein
MSSPKTRVNDARAVNTAADRRCAPSAEKCWLHADLACSPKPDPCANSKIRVVQTDVVSAAQHFQHIAATVGKIVLIVERMRRDLGARRLPPQVGEILLAHRAIDRPKSDVLKFAHFLSRHIDSCSL